MPGMPGPAGKPARRRGLLDRIVGPRSVAVRHRTGLPDDVASEHLAEWLQRRHRLRIRIAPDGTVIGVRRRGVVPAMMRGARSASGIAGLAGVKEVRGAAVSAEPGHTAICLVADLGDQRAQSVAVGSGIALGGAFLVSGVALITAPVTLAGLPVAVGAGWVVTRLTHRYRVGRILEEVEITADQVAAGALPSRSRRVIESQIRKRLAGGASPSPATPEDT
jgi:hypothetical protein